MNFSAFKNYFKKSIKNDEERSRPDTRTRESTSGLIHMQDQRKIPAIVNEKVVIKC